MSDRIYETGLTVHHGMLIFTISLLFLVFKWLEEVVLSRQTGMNQE